MNKLKRKIKLKNIFLVILILIIIFIVSCINITKWIIDSYKSNNNIKTIQKETNVIEVQDSTNTEIIKT